MSTDDTKKGGNPLTIFIISLCAAIVMAGGYCCGFWAGGSPGGWFH